MWRRQFCLCCSFCAQNGKELTWGYITAVPWWVYLGSVCGLLAQLLQIIGTLHSNTLVSSVLMLVGNLGMSLTLDYVFYGTFSLLRARPGSCSSCSA